MLYDKSPLTLQQQAELLISRGLVANKDILISRLETVCYYRLTAYLYPFRQNGKEEYRENTSLELVWKYYTFDRQLRIIVMDALERIEVAVRSQLAFRFTCANSPFDYTCFENMSGFNSEDEFDRWLKEMKHETKRSRETFLEHFREKYGDIHEMPPLWMLVEIMSFGKMYLLYKGVNSDIRRELACSYAISDTVLTSWLHTLMIVRNICAHHGRLWNRELRIKPFIPRVHKYPQWHTPFVIQNNRIFSVLTILKYLLQYVAPTSNWNCRFRDLLRQYPEIPIGNMGFPHNWEEHAIWKDSL